MVCWIVQATFGSGVLISTMVGGWRRLGGEEGKCGTRFAGPKSALLTIPFEAVLLVTICLTSSAFSATATALRIVTIITGSDLPWIEDELR